MQKFLLNFEAKNKAEAQKHQISRKPITKISNPSYQNRPWKQKKKIDDNNVKESPVSHYPTEKIAADEEKKEEVVVEKGAEKDGDAFSTLSTKEVASPTVSYLEGGSSIVSHVCRPISVNATTDDRPIESVSELKQWLMKSGPDTTAGGRNYGNTADAHAIDKQTEGNTGIIRSARSNLRRISDQAVCEEMPLLHVSDAKTFLLNFERGNREHYQKSSVQKPHKKIGRLDMKPKSPIKEGVKEEVSENETFDDIVTIDDIVTVESKVEEPKDCIDSISAEMELPPEPVKSMEEVGEKEQETKDREICFTVPEVEEAAEKEDDPVEESVDVSIDEAAIAATLQVTLDEEDMPLNEISFNFRTSGVSDASTLLSEEPMQLRQAEQQSDVFRKRYRVDPHVEDKELTKRVTKKLRRGLNMLKSLACPNPAKVVFNMENRYKMTQNPTATMSSSADQEDFVALESPCNSEMSATSYRVGIARGGFPSNQAADFSVNSPGSDSLSSLSSDGLPTTTALVINGKENVDEEHITCLERKFRLRREGNMCEF